MRFKVSQYYLFVVALLTLVMVFHSWEIGIRYILFFLINVFMLNFARKTHGVIMLMILATFFLCYFLRGFVVATDYSMFTFINLYDVDYDKILWSFDTALVASLSMSLGLLLSSFRFTTKQRKPQNTENHSFLNSSFLLVMLILFALAMMKILLIKFGDVGLKGEEQHGPLAFLQALAPIDLPYIVLGVYFFKYNRTLSIVKKVILVFILCIFSYSILLSGSKIFVMAFAMCYLVYLLFSKSKISLVKFVFLVTIGAMLATLSFGMSRAVKVSFYTPHLTSKDVFLLGIKYWKENDPLKSMALVTQRFNGFDGQLKYLGIQKEKERDNLQKVKRSFAVDVILLNVLEGFIPRVELTDEIPSGVAIGRYAEKFNPKKQYAGALGLVAASLLISEKYYYVVLLVLGFVIGVLAKGINFIRHPDLQFMFLYLLAYFSMMIVMSGNIDAVFFNLLSKSVILVFFSFFIVQTHLIVRQFARSKILTYET